MVIDVFEYPSIPLNMSYLYYQNRDHHVKDHDRLIFKMGVPIAGKGGLYIESEPRSYHQLQTSVTST